AARHAVTDSLGRFRLLVPGAGRWTLTLSHAALDSVGLYGVGAAVEVPAAGASDVLVAVPSLATLWARVCGEAAPADARMGIVSGTVSRADGGAPAADATVRLEWLAIDTVAKRMAVRPLTLEAQTDSSGNFYVCGVRAGRELELRATAAGAASGTVFARLADRRLARVNLVVAPATDDGRPAAAAVGVITGRVRLDNDWPQSGARVRVLGEEREVRTDTAGRFRLTGVPTGSRTLQVLTLGFEPEYLTVSPRAGETVSVTVTLKPALQLAPVTITAGLVRQFEDFERRRRLGFGHFVTSEELEGRQVLRSVFEMLPSIRTVGTAFNWMAMGRDPGGQPCVLSVLIDGRRASWDELRTYRPHHITALEVYPRYFSGPIELLPAGSQCGAVLVWTNMG
ncbi:MAG TPA: carboxypeptidase-like regulatory domain-containing protein, partial [Gemmatimonadaceae bacterium]|nr:carboxypeptidase-like regulatory domain-containing protein [Gemmatimonadaceae bacterium]